MRLFTALDIPENFRSRVAAFRDSDALEARWSPPDQYHITLRFIGDVDGDEISRYEEIISDITAPIARCIPYGLDVLPSRQNPSVVIVGLERSDSLLAVYDELSAALEELGLEPEGRRFRPHVTLARVHDGTSPEAVHAYLRSQSADDLPSFQAKYVHLYESTLTQDGAIHDRRLSVPLGTD